MTKRINWQWPSTEDNTLRPWYEIAKNCLVLPFVLTAFVLNTVSKVLRLICYGLIFISGMIIECPPHLRSKKTVSSDFAKKAYVNTIMSKYGMSKYEI